MYFFSSYTASQRGHLLSIKQEKSYNINCINRKWYENSELSIGRSGHAAMVQWEGRGARAPHLSPCRWRNPGEVRSKRKKSESDVDTSLSDSSTGADAPAAAFGKTAYADFASARGKSLYG
ncbi:MAG: hypothetical protein PUC46_05855 [Lachnospiraceae bacterium]|nr:hypothetical protein [Lachnospiraceae bacterium]